MYAREISSESVYTLREARRIIKAEQLRKREEFLNKAKYFALGVLCLLICLLIPVVLDGDITAWFVFIPCALYFFTKMVKGDEINGKMD